MQTQTKQVTQESIAHSRALRRKASARYAQDKAAFYGRAAQVKAWRGDTIGESFMLSAMNSWSKIAESYGIDE